ncbi:hypothetical protein PoB_001766300 [Plakobranchus ocellatus]|uniref:Uncharacterized protein n=1 Tax=Plakobranchus ocellatus TaxID=259542 RepID=A0AAV3Z8U1_9GAST|nr:hypothetical protein PoB_001766300 [Plakobranchus ocellatus]
MLCRGAISRMLAEEGRLKSVIGGRYRDSRVFLAAAMLTLESFWGRVILACYTGEFEFLYIASPQQGDLRLSGSPSGQGAGSATPAAEAFVNCYL